jgi:transposase InsO family protein
LLGIKSLRTPIRAPRANAIAERWVRTVRGDCLDHLIPLSERHLRAILTEFVHYYNHDRPHRSFGLQPPAPRPQIRHGGITVRPVLGGLHHIYERVA